MCVWSFLSKLWLLLFPSKVDHFDDDDEDEDNDPNGEVFLLNDICLEKRLVVCLRAWATKNSTKKVEKGKKRKRKKTSGKGCFRQSQFRILASIPKEL